MKLEKGAREALEKFVIDNRNLEELEQKISRFNIFEAIGMVRQEIKHSNFIQFLLPKFRPNKGQRAVGKKAASLAKRGKVVNA